MNEIEYVYFSPKKLDFPLFEDIKILDKTDENIQAIVSNSQMISSQVYAPEINLYVEKSEDDLAERIKSVKILYDARLIAFNNANFSDFTREVGTKVVVISKEDAKLKSALAENGFQAAFVAVNEIVSIDGSIGEFEINIRKKGEIISVLSDQAVFFEQNAFPDKQGLINAAGLSSDDIIERLKSGVGERYYQNYISYNADICQYRLRRDEICGKCVEECKTSAILKDNDKRELIFSHLDCVDCGGCVSVCPSGSLDYAKMPKEAFLQIAKTYKNKIPLIIDAAKAEKLNSLGFKIPKGVLPFAVDNVNFLHETHFITLLQESGAQAIIYTDDLMIGTKNAVYLLNEIWERKHRKKAIFLALSEEELGEAFANASFVENSTHSVYDTNDRKREVFSKRLFYAVGEDDFGVVKTNSVPNEIVRYGYVKINKDKCTLCLSCVGACNVGALQAVEEDFSLRLNDSICTTCKYCEFSCPEKCIEVVRGELPLNKRWFEWHTVAKDEPCRCALCGKPYASKRSVEKVADMMRPIFGEDETKIKTLYCCSECKPKVMMSDLYIKE